MNSSNRTAKANAEPKKTFKNGKVYGDALSAEEKKKIVAQKKKDKKSKKVRKSAQQTIPYVEMCRDGICKVNSRLYTKTVRFNDINYQLAQNEDKTAIFKQYILTTEEIVEVRYRTETRVGSYTTTDPETGATTTHYYTYEVEVPYNYYIMNVTLENFNLSHVPVYIMSQDQLSMYATYMSVLGNREDLFPDSPYYYFKFVRGKKQKDEDLDFFDDEGYEEEPYVNEDAEPDIAEDDEDEKTEDEEE